MTLNQMKEEAKAQGKTMIRRNEESAPLVPLDKWAGVSTNPTLGTFSGLPAVGWRQVTYEIQGNKVRAKRAGDKEFWYELS